MNTEKMYLPTNPQQKAELVALHPEYQAERWLGQYVKFDSIESYHTWIDDWKASLKPLVDQQRLTKKLAKPLGYSAGWKEWQLIWANAEKITVMLAVRRLGKLWASEKFNPVTEPVS